MIRMIKFDFKDHDRDFRLAYPLIVFVEICIHIKFTRNADKTNLYMIIDKQTIQTITSSATTPPFVPGSEFLYRRMVSEARGDVFVKATCLENSDQSLTLFLTE